MTTAAAAQPAAITGLGAVTPLGQGIDALWSGLLDGRSGAVALTGPEFAELPVRIGAPVTAELEAVLGRVPARRLDRSEQLAVVAAREAWAQAGSPDVDPLRLAVVIGTGVGGVITLFQAMDTLREKGARAVSAFTVPMLMANGAAAAVGLELGARAAVHAPVSACASGAEAISLALDLLRLGRADVVVCGGTEAALHPVPMAAFAAMRALSAHDGDPAGASRPFDKGRDGFVLGEGAGVLVLETEAHARARGAEILGLVAGAGIAADSHHVAQPDPTGAGAARSITLALHDAGAAPREVVHLNAHATSTPAGDVAEARAVRTALGGDADRVVVSATKSMTGHLLGAAGAVEAIATVLALRTGLAPAIRNLDNPDDDVDLDLARHEPRTLSGDGVALSTSFGFGGHDVALAFRRSA